MPDKLGRIQKGEHLSAATEFKQGQHWRSRKPFWDRDWLYEEYVTKHRSSTDIAAQFAVTDATIIFWLHKHNIPRRTTSEARRIKYWGNSGKANPMFGRRGAKSSNWKGGVTPERQRCYSTIEWHSAEKAVIERDQNTCQRCGKRGKRSHLLHIHHITPFQVVESRCDPENLVMLCAKCHRWVHSKKNTNQNFIRKGGLS